MVERIANGSIAIKNNSGALGQPRLTPVDIGLRALFFLIIYTNLG